MKTKLLLLLICCSSISVLGQNSPKKGQSPAPCKQTIGDLCFKNTCEKAITVSLNRGPGLAIKTIDLLKGQESCMYDLQEGGYTYAAREKASGSGWNSQDAGGLSTPFTNEVKVKKCEELRIEIPNFLE